MKRILLLLVIASGFCKAQSFNLISANKVGGTGNDAGTHVFVDGGGNIYTVGYFEGTVDLDPGAGVSTATSSGAEDIFIIKQNQSGALVWAKSFGGANTDMPAGIGVDGTGNVYVSGHYGSIIDLDPGPATYSFFAGSIEVFVLKLDASGNFVWGVSMGSGGNDKAMTMCVDAVGSVYTAGYYEGTMDFDPGAGNYDLTPAGSLGDIFVSKLTSAGNFAWASSIGGVDVENPAGICIDGLSNVYLTGFFENVCDFDPGAGTFTLDAGAAGRDAFTCKLDGNGALVWAKQFGGVGDQHGCGVAIDANNVYVSGDFQNTTDLDPGAGTMNATSTGTFYSGFAIKLSNTGNFVWGNSISGSDDVLGNTIKLSPAGNVYWAGYLKGITDIDPGAGTKSVTPFTSMDSYVTEIDNSGNYLFADFFPYEWGTFHVNASNQIILTGKFDNTRDFDPDVTISNLSSAGLTDVCLVKLGFTGAGLNENRISNDASIYPNPTQGELHISLNENAVVRITNELGETVLELHLVSGIQKLELKEAPGIYFMNVTGESGVVTRKKLVIGN